MPSVQEELSPPWELAPILPQSVHALQSKLLCDVVSKAP